MALAPFQDGDPIDPKWIEGLRRIKTRRAWAVVLSFVFMILFSRLDGYLEDGWPHRDIKLLTLWLFVFVPIEWMIVSPWLRSRCPRCSNLFYSGVSYGNGLSRKCMTCRLPMSITRR